MKNLLDEHWASKKINVKTKWKQFRPTIKSDPRYLAMIAEEIEGYLDSNLALTRTHTSITLTKTPL